MEKLIIINNNWENVVSNKNDEGFCWQFEGEEYYLQSWKCDKYININTYNVRLGGGFEQDRELFRGLFEYIPFKEYTQQEIIEIFKKYGVELEFKTEIETTDE